MTSNGFTVISERRSTVGLIRDTMYESHSVYNWHNHATTQMCLPVAGHYDERTEQAAWKCGKGDIVVHQRGVTHMESTADEPTRCVSIHLAPEIESRLPESIIRNPRSLRLQDLDTSDVSHLILRHIMHWDTHAERILEGLLTAVIGMFARGAAARPGCELGGHDWLDEARELIEDNFASSLSLSAIAVRVNRSRSAVSTLFRRRFGCSVGQYIHLCRLRRARHLLRTTNQSIAAVALQSGFCDQPHLTRAMQRGFGTTPGQIRRSGGRSFNP